MYYVYFSAHWIPALSRRGCSEEDYEQKKKIYIYLLYYKLLHIHAHTMWIKSVRCWYIVLYNNIHVYARWKVVKIIKYVYTRQRARIMSVRRKANVWTRYTIYHQRTFFGSNFSNQGCKKISRKKIKNISRGWILYLHYYLFDKNKLI